MYFHHLVINLIFGLGSDFNAVFHSIYQFVIFGTKELKVNGVYIHTELERDWARDWHWEY